MKRVSQIFQASAFAAALLVPLFLSVPVQAASWEVARDEQGIKVSLSDVGGSDYKMFRGETVIATSVGRLMTAFSDQSSCKSWRFKCGAYVSLGSGYFYRRTTLPWPLSDRFVITRNTQPNETTLLITHIPLAKLPKNIIAKLPDHDGLVEMKQYSGSWKLKQINEGEVEVVYEIRGNPAGNIPSSMVNKGTVDAPFSTLLKLKEYLK